jgi:ribonuclease-3
MPVSSSRNLKIIEDLIGYTFQNNSLLLEALTHSSYSNEHPDEDPPYNERLEFLGDAVLGLVVVEELYRGNSSMSESEMSKLKSFLVSKVVLADLSRRLELGEYILLGKGEESSGGRDKDNILADALEALLGAIFVDSNYISAREATLRLFGATIQETIEGGRSYDFKTELQEVTQNKYNALPEYRVVREEGEEHDKTFVVEVYINKKSMGMGMGKSKKEAQMSAAEKALDRMAEAKENSH